MTIFLMRTYVVYPDKLKEHDVWGKRLVALMKEKPALFKEVRSLEVLSQKYGDSFGGFAAMWKYKSLVDLEKWGRRFKATKELSALKSDFLRLVVPETYSAKIWEQVKILRRPQKTSPR